MYKTFGKPQLQNLMCNQLRNCVASPIWFYFVQRHLWEGGLVIIHIWFYLIMYKIFPNVFTGLICLFPLYICHIWRHMHCLPHPFPFVHLPYDVTVVFHHVLSPSPLSLCTSTLFHHGFKTGCKGICERSTFKRFGINHFKMV